MEGGRSPESINSLVGSAQNGLEAMRLPVGSGGQESTWRGGKEARDGVRLHEARHRPL